MMFSSTIRLKLLLISSLVLLLVFGGMTVYLVRANTYTLRANLQNEAKAFAGLATPPIAEAYNLYADSGTSYIKQAMGGYLDLNKDITNVAIVDFQGQTLFAYNGGALMHLSSAQASSFTPLYLKQGSKLKEVLYPYFETSGAHSFSVVYSISNEQIDQAIHHEVASLVFFGVVLLLLTSALTYLVINRIIVKPIREVSRQAKIISSGDLEQQIIVHGNDEIATLGSAVNAMAESLKANITKLKEVDKVKTEFMAITSHNLRTPLTIINSYLENSDQMTNLDQYRKAMDRIGASVKRLGSFAEDVLTISHLELGGHDQLRENVGIADFMRDLLLGVEPAVKLKEVEFTSHIETNEQVNVSPPQLRSAVWNIIDNAIKFTPKNGKIDLNVSSSSGQVHIAVRDNGIGISADEIPKLFTKFHRGTSVTKYDYEGTGIGLYATKLIIEEMGGNIDVDTKESEGSCFTINLPVATAENKVHNQA